MKKQILLGVFLLCILLFLTGCDWVSESVQDNWNTIELGDKLAKSQPTPTDVDYSLERYNLIRREYWVNGQREKANTLVCPVYKPLGYVTLFADNGSVVQQFVVDGKVSSSRNYLTPDSEYYSYGSSTNRWLPDTDGTYGDNVDGIYFFTPDGNYLEWTGTYLYSDIPFKTESAVLQVENVTTDSEVGD